MLDRFDKDASFLKDKKLFLLDMDGTIYNENTLFEGTLDFLRLIEENGGRYIFITNNSSKSVKDYVKKVNNMGIPADEESFFTSAQATALHINKHHNGKVVYCVGTESLKAELVSFGIPLCDTVQDAEVLLIGYDTELTYEKLRKASEILFTKDVPYIATNPDKGCPTEFGLVPDCAGFCEMFYMITGKRPLYIGKPAPTMINYVMEKYKNTPEETVVVGDRLYTDIASGINAGVTAVCVLSGEATLEDVIDSEVKPSLTLDSIRDISAIIRGE
ncbi:MAG: HAD-IIA family hydrolase [Clostridiales bacterium]|nr:HAD-IIA family hydrolase [Clostridiales bacterium]